MTRAGPDVAVIGGGVMGLSAAMWAAQGGAQVTIIEARHVASGSSGLSAGIVGTHYSLPSDVAIRKESLDYFAALGDEVGFLATGVLRAVATDAELKICEAAADVQRAHEARAEILDQEGIADVFPEMAADDLAGAIWMPDGGHVDGHLLCNAFLARAEACGARLRANARLTDVAKSHGRWKLRTDAGEIAADVVINAAGAWSEQIGRRLGHAVPIVNQRHEMAIAKLARPRERMMPNVGLYFAGPEGLTAEGLYWRPESADRLLVSIHGSFDPSVAGEDPDNWSKVVSDDMIEALAEKLHRRLPGLPDIGLAKGWAGLYPMTVDDLPSVGPWSGDSSLVDCCGAGGVGIQISVAAGRVAAEWALGDEPVDNWAPLILPERPTVQP